MYPVGGSGGRANTALYNLCYALLMQIRPTESSNIIPWGDLLPPQHDTSHAAGFLIKRIQGTTSKTF
jgi:hypothetical protein